jgi:hypothetical protein
MSCLCPYVVSTRCVVLLPLFLRHYAGHIAGVACVERCRVARRIRRRSELVPKSHPTRFSIERAPLGPDSIGRTSYSALAESSWLSITAILVWV